tara:strand:+ start:245 stop:754 length:510 start_codon:yes stop_codon:yes gene_type:complete
MSEFRRYKQLTEKINALDQKLKRVEQDRNRMAGDLFAGGVTLNEQLMERNQPLGLVSPEASGTAVPAMPQISGAGVLQPLSPEQTSRVFNAQQYRDMLNASRRFTEDQFAVGEKFRKNEMLRQLEGAKRRQRIATQATLLQQGQLGAQSMAGQSQANIGAILGSTPVYQ